jgi:signal transduction histidine kinase
VNIRIRLLLMVFAVWLVAASSFALLARSIYLQETQAGRERVREFGRTLNLTLERELDKRTAMARTLGASRSLRNGDLQAFYEEAVGATRGTDSWVILVDPTTEVINTRLPWRPDLRIARGPDAPMVLDEIARTFFVPVGHGSQGPAVAVLSPQLGVTPPRYDVGVAFDPRIIQALVDEQRGDISADLVSVTDGHQRVMARTRDPEKWIGRQAGPEVSRRARDGIDGFLESRTLDGVDSLTYISPPNRYHWTVVVATPKQTLTRTAQRLTVQAVEAAGIMLLVALGLVLYVSRRIGEPVQALGAAAAALREDQVPLQLTTGIQEIDAISRVLHEAGVRSHQATQTLELRVLDAVRQAEEAQAKLMDAQKHEAIGRLTGGLAHDFNNLLQTIRTALQVFQFAPDAAPPARVLDSAIRATNRAADLVRQMLAFGRARPQEVSAVNFANFLLDARELVQKAVGRGIELVADVEAGLPNIAVDPSQLELALLNLVFNARDAMPGGGRVTVSARRAGAERVIVAVADTGAGMDAQTLRRALEPYFTTKAIGVGSGLGLAQVRGFAVECGGSVQLHSAPGEGTRVEMSLPATSLEAPVDEAAAPPAAPERPLHVLMVEDDVLVQSVVVPALEAAGHTVTLVATADAALGLLRQGHPLDVVFTDVVMPGKMTGMDLADWCRQNRPALPVVVATGYSAQSSDGVPVLRKPYELAALRTALALAAARERPAG